MTYLVLNAPFLLAAAAVAAVAIARSRSPRWRAVALAGIGLMILTAVFDNVLVGTGIVGYDPELISGVRIGVAPIEDFAYALAALLMLPALWRLFAPRAADAEEGDA